MKTRLFPLKLVYRSTPLFLSLFLAACIEPSGEIKPTINLTVIPSTIAPLSPTSTYIPEPTTIIEPSPIPVTSLPSNLETIELGNVDKLQTIIRFTIELDDFRASDPVFSPDGRILGVASRLGEVILWDLENFEVLRTISTSFGSRGDKSPFINYPALAFSPDGRYIAAVTEREEDETTDQSHAGGVGLWELDKEGEPFLIEPTWLYVVCLAYSPDGSLLAVGTKDFLNAGESRIILYTPNGEEVRTIEVPGEGVKSLAFLPDGQIIAAGGVQGIVGLWNVNTGEEVNRLGTWPTDQIDISPDGKMLALGNGTLWDIDSGEMIISMDASQMIFSPDGHMLAFIHDGGVSFLDLTTWNVLLGLDEDEKNLRAAFSPDGRLLATISEYGVIQLWGIPSTQEPHHASLLLKPENASEIEIIAQVQSGSATDVAFHSDGGSLALAQKDGTLTLWDISLNKILHDLPGHADWIYRVAYSANGFFLASASKDGTIRLWDLYTPGENITLAEHTGEVTSVTFSPVSTELASGSEDQTVKIWNMYSGEEIRSLTGHEKWVWGVAYSPDGRFLASASADRTVKLWYSETGQELHTMRGHEATVWQVAFSPNGIFLASASWDGTLKIWDFIIGEEIRTLHGHTDWVYDLAFSLDGLMLASGSRNGEVIIWDAYSGEQLTTLQSHSAAVRGIAFSPDGHFLASVSEDGLLNIWGIKP